MLDKKLTQLKHYFGIFTDTDWQDVSPAMILRQDGIGPKTLEYIRAVLALRGLALKDDRTPEYWQQHLDCARVLSTMGDDDEGNDRGLIVPFVVLVDSAEQQPYTFQGLRSDASQGNRPLIVPIERQALGRGEDSLGDYSLSSGLGRCHVERKSLDDFNSTLLGWSGRRDRLETELENLSRLESSLVIIEATFGSAINDVQARGARTKQQNAKSVHRSAIAFLQDYRVPFLFCDSRRLAEITVFRWLERFDRKQREIQKLAENRAAIPRIAAAPPISPISIQQELAAL